MSISKKPQSKSRKPTAKEPQSLIINEQTAWPENPNGYIVPQKGSEDFIGNHSLLKAQITARRFMVVADAGRAIVIGELISFFRFQTCLDFQAVV
jgi:hypothetical protein